MKQSRIHLLRFSLLCFFFFFFLSLAARAEFTHTVKKGESLSSIARDYHISISRVQEANGLEVTSLQIGQRLIIPPKTHEVEARPINRKGVKEESAEIARSNHEPETHMVRKGETLGKIAQRHNLSVKELQEINKLKGGLLQIGQILRLKPESEEQEELAAEMREADHSQVLTSPDHQKTEAQGMEALSEERNSSALVGVARSFLGVKYRRGGTSLVYGLDCSAFVQKVFQVIGVDLPRTAREQFEVGLEVARDALRLGDLVFFKPSKGRRPSHVGIYIGNGQFIHTSLSKRKVRVDSLNAHYFSTRFIGGRRMIEEPKKEPAIERSPAEYANLLENNSAHACCPSDFQVP